MTWLAPGALFGLVALAAPILVHWLARQQATRLRFPTLQFLTATPPVSVRRHRIQDWVLLLVRMAIIGLAVAALAQPVWMRPAAPVARPARAIVLDTSASLSRLLVDGRLGTTVALEAANGLAADAGPRAHVVPADNLPAGITRAAAWLAQQPEPREVVIVSDLQVGALLAADLEVLPSNVGVRLLPIGVSGAVLVPTREPVELVVSVSDAQSRPAAAAEAAARATVSVAGDSTASADAPRVRIVFADAPDAAQVRKASQPLSAPAMFDRVASIEAERERVGLATPDTDWRRVDADLTVFTALHAGSVEAAALMAAILQSDPTQVPSGEREPDVIPVDEWTTWQRDAGSPGVPLPNPDESDGRWLWGLVLLLLGVETWLRRPVTSVKEVRHDRAA